MTQSSLKHDLSTFVGFGEHRVGTPGEVATVKWLEQRLKAAGYTTTIDDFSVKTLLNPGGLLSAFDQKIKAFPQWLPPSDALGKVITAPLQALEAPAGASSIRVLSSPTAFTANWIPRLDNLVREAAAKGGTALIMAIKHPTDDLFVCNQHSHDPFSIPVALIANRDLATLSKALHGANPSSATSPASLTLLGETANIKGLNVIGKKPGKGRMIVLSTPLTGWFACGGERGSGIALWLRMAQALAQSDRPVLMLGTGSHEVGHLGMAHALSHGAPSPNEVALWFHFGASLAATKLDTHYRFKTPQYLVGLPTSESWAKSALLKHLPLYVAGNSATHGEAGQVIGAGHQRFVGISGFFPGFHTPADDGQSVDYEKLEDIAQASLALIQGVAALPDQ